MAAAHALRVVRVSCFFLISNSVFLMVRLGARVPIYLFHITIHSQRPEIQRSIPRKVCQLPQVIVSFPNVSSIPSIISFITFHIHMHHGIVINPPPDGKLLSSIDHLICNTGMYCVRNCTTVMLTSDIHRELSPIAGTSHFVHFPSIQVWCILG